VLMNRHDSPAEVEKLLAQAYSQQRTLELRLPGANHALIKEKRGKAPSRLDLPEPLLKAEAITSHNLAVHEDDPGWLKASAQVDLLEWDYEAAIVVLEKAHRLDSNNHMILLDLAVAYFERAQSLDRPSDYGEAINLFSKVLAITPMNPVALFDRAIAEERLYMYDQAIDDWDKYLQVGHEEDGWRDEARQRRDQVKEKQANHDNKTSMPLLTPAEFLEVTNSNGDSIRLDISSRLEEYQDLAIREWLPRGLITVGNRSNDQDDYIEAAKRLASILARQF